MSFFMSVSFVQGDAARRQVEGAYGGSWALGRPCTRPLAKFINFDETSDEFRGKVVGNAINAIDEFGANDDEPFNEAPHHLPAREDAAHAAERHRA
jgi:hypothetical protein